MKKPLAALLFALIATVGHADDGSMEQLTSEPTSKTSGFMLKAPEYGNKYVFFTRVGVGEGAR